MLTHSKRFARKRNDELIRELKEGIEQNLGRTMTDLAKEMAMARSTTGLAVHQDLHYMSFALKKRQLLTEKKERQKLNLHSAGFLTFFSGEKNVIQGRKINHQIDPWIRQVASEVPTVIQTKMPASAMV